MNSKIKNVVIFLSGIASGAAGAFIFVKMKWQKDFEAKREEMIRYYKEKSSGAVVDYNDLAAPPDIPEEETDDGSDNIERMNRVIAHYNYAKVPDPNERTKNTSPSLLDDYSDEPYEIDGREFGSQEMYGMLTFFLHDDGEILTDKYVPLDEDSINDYIGAKNLERLADMRDADPELDAFYVRNDRLKVDCEILIGAESMENDG